MPEEEKNIEEEKKAPLKFKCPNCGNLTQEEVIFLCNKCPSTELIYKSGVYLCPSCLRPGENFECFNCGSKGVKLLDSTF